MGPMAFDFRVKADETSCECGDGEAGVGAPLRKGDEREDLGVAVIW